MGIIPGNYLCSKIYHDIVKISTSVYIEGYPAEIPYHDFICLPTVMKKFV